MGIQAALGSQMQQLMDAGATEAEALAAIVPTLADLQTSGVDLAPGTEDLIARAVANGFIFPQGLDERRNDLLQGILDVLRGSPEGPGNHPGTGPGRGPGPGRDDRSTSKRVVRELRSGTAPEFEHEIRRIIRGP